MQRKIHEKLPEFLLGFPPESKYKAEPVDWTEAHKCLEVGYSVGSVNWATPGTKGGVEALNQFCQKRLQKYAFQSNYPTYKVFNEWTVLGKIRYMSYFGIEAYVNRHRGKQHKHFPPS